MRRLMGWLAVILLVALWFGFADPRNGFPPCPTREQALGEVLDKQVSIRYAEPFDRKRDLVLFTRQTTMGHRPRSWSGLVGGGGA